MKIFKHEAYGSIRVETISGVKYCVANDVLRVLGYSNVSSSGRVLIRRYCNDIGIVKYRLEGTQYNMIDGNNVHLLLRSSPFGGTPRSEWIKTHVLPYLQNKQEQDNITYISSLSTEAKDKMLQDLIKANSELKREVMYYREVLRKIREVIQ